MPIVRMFRMRLLYYGGRTDKTNLMTRSWCIRLLCALWAVPSWGQSPPARDVSTSEESLSHARQLMQQGKYDDAIAELQKLSSAQPGMKVK